MGEIEVFQRDRADVVVIRHLIGVRMGVAVRVRPCVGFCAVAGILLVQNCAGMNKI